MNRKEKLDHLFRRAEVLIKKFYPEGASRATLADDLTAISVAHFSNYLPEIVPEARPYLARVITYILDLEIDSSIIGEIKHAKNDNDSNS